MLLQVGLASEAETTCCTVEVSLSLVVDGASVILKGAFVAEGGSADVAVEDVTSVRSQHVSGQAGFACECRITRITLVRLVCGVGLHVACQSLLILKLHSAFWAGVGICVVAVMELFMHSQVVLSGEGFWAVSTSELIILLVCSLVPSQAVTPLEGLSALATHVFAVTRVAVHVARQMLFHPG